MAEFTIKDLMQVFLVLLRNKLLIVLFTAAGLFFGLYFSTVQASEKYKYEASTTLSVVFGQNLGQITGTMAISNYADIVTSDFVCEHAAMLLADTSLTSSQIQRMLSTSSGSNSYILKISARNASPRTAILVSNAVAESFVAQVSVITGSNTIQVLDQARSAIIIYTGKIIDIRLIAPIGAFALICAALIITELVNGKVRSIEQCIVDDGELLAVIPKVKAKP